MIDIDVLDGIGNFGLHLKYWKKVKERQMLTGEITGGGEDDITIFSVNCRN